MTAPVRIVIGVPMSNELVQQIRDVDPRVDVVFDASFFPGERFLGDHHGSPAQKRSDDERDRFFDYLSDAEIVYGIPELRPSGLRRVVESNPSLRWVHAAQAGAGAFVWRGWSLDDDPASPFVEAFYDALVAGSTIEQAANAGRAAARAAGDPSGLAFAVYAHPEARLRIE